LLSLRSASAATNPYDTIIASQLRFDSELPTCDI